MNAAGVWGVVAVLAAGAGSVLSVLQLSLQTASRLAVEQAASRVSRSRRPANGEGVAGEDRVLVAAWAINGDQHGHVAAVAEPRVAFNSLAAVAAVLSVASLGQSREPSAADALIGLAVAAAVLWLTAVVLPLSVADHAGARTVVAFRGPIRLMHGLMLPARAVLGFVSEVVRRLSGESSRTEAEAREAELLSLVEESERAGGLDEDSREMIEAVVEFRSRTVEQIMTPRTEIEALEYTDDLAAVQRRIEETHHSRLPVFEESLDRIRGVLYVKDLLRWMVLNQGPIGGSVGGSGGGAGDGSGGGFRLQDILREATFVPETKTVRELLTELLEEQVHIAFALDEYGGTSGIVTIEDIVEEVFGEIRDEYEPEEQDEPGVVVDEARGVATIDARTEIGDANSGLEALGLRLPEHDDYDTVGGFVVTTLGKIPETGEVVTVPVASAGEPSSDGIALAAVVTVLEAEPTRVVRVAVEPARAS